jgi:hypothetical protein
VTAELDRCRAAAEAARPFRIGTPLRDVAAGPTYDHPWDTPAIVGTPLRDAAVDPRPEEEETP